MDFASYCHFPSYTVHLTNIIIFPIIGKGDKIIKLLVSVNGKLIQFKFIELFSAEQYQCAYAIIISDKHKIVIIVFALCEVKVFLTEIPMYKSLKVIIK